LLDKDFDRSKIIVVPLKLDIFVKPWFVWSDTIDHMYIVYCLCLYNTVILPHFKIIQ
jgi:hypothetical protein